MLRNVMGNTRMNFVAGAILMCLASAASAQSLTIVGGGATLPDLAYTGQNSSSLQTPVTGSLLAAYTDNGNPATTYCPTGSGGGKNVLTGAASVSAACGSGGFSGTGLTQPHFVGSDSPLSQTDFNTYRTNRGATAAPVQFPAVAGAIAVAFNKSGVTSLNLNEDQICRIFSGDIKTWQALQASGGTGLPSGITGDITIVSRVDGSGTSFNFSNHLSAMCPTRAVAATQFQTDQLFSNAVLAYSGNYAHALTAQGNSAVVTTIGTTEGAIGYAEVANVVVGSPTRFAAVANVNAPSTFIDPSTYGGALSVSISYDKAIGSNVNGRPTLVDLPTTTQCIGVVDPSNYATPATGYPIVAVSYLLGNAQGNNTSTGLLTAVRRVLFAPWNTTIRANTSTIGANTGFGYLADASGGMTQSKVNACVN
jgi:phosphate transport system substrate-binding protein